MKMKQKAEGEAGVPDSSRVYLNIVLPAAESAALPQLPEQRAFWFDQVRKI